MLLYSGTEDNYVIEVEQNTVEIHIGEYGCHQPLKGGWRIHEAEGHPGELIQAHGRCEGRLWDVLLCHLYLEIS